MVVSGMGTMHGESHFTAFGAFGKLELNKLVANKKASYLGIIKRQLNFKFENREKKRVGVKRGKNKRTEAKKR